MLAEYLKILEINPDQLTNLSYNELNLQQKFRGNQILASAMNTMPASLADKIATLPQYAAKKEHRLIEKGKAEQHAFLITSGQAFATDGAILKPGKIVGEFSALEGKRTMDVVCSEDFRAIILPKPIIRNILDLPGYMSKYLDWKFGKAVQSLAIRP